jgi:hypothetical protein
MTDNSKRIAPPVCLGQQCICKSVLLGDFAAVHESGYGTDFQLLHRTKSRRDPGTADMTDGLSGLNSGAHDPVRTSGPASSCVFRSIQPSQSWYRLPSV